MLILDLRNLVKISQRTSSLADIIRKSIQSNSLSLFYLRYQRKTQGHYRILLKNPNFS